MKMSSLRYILPEPFISIKRNPLMSLTAIGTVAITFFLCGLFSLVILNINLNALMMESSVEIKVFAYTDATEEVVTELGSNLEAIENVASVSFVSKDTGLDLLSASYGSETDIVAALDENPLPDSYTILASDADYVADIATAAANLENVEEVRYGQDSVEKLFVALDWIRIIGFGVMGLLIISALFLIGMNIRLTVTARKEEIEVMKYVGASNSFVAWPFILEGIILSLLGAIVALIATFILYSKIFTMLEGSLSFVAFVGVSSIAVVMTLIFIGAGIVLGAIASSIAVRKFLKV